MRSYKNDTIERQKANERIKITRLILQGSLGWVRFQRNFYGKEKAVDGSIRPVFFKYPPHRMETQK